MAEVMESARAWDSPAVDSVWGSPPEITTMMDYLILCPHTLPSPRSIHRLQVSASGCFDPNEEHKLRQVISAVGEEKVSGMVEHHSQP